MPAATLHQPVKFSFKFQNTQIDGQKIPEGAQISYYLDIEDEAGTIRQFPPVGEPGLPDTPGDLFTHTASPAELGMGIGKYKVHARTHVVDVDGTQWPGERSSSYAPLDVRAVAPRFIFSWSALMAWIKSRL